MKRVSAVLAAIAACTLLGAGRANPPPKPSARPAPKPSAGAWSLQTEQLYENLQSGDVSAPVHISMVRGDGSTIDADRAQGNTKKRTWQLYGQVKLHDTSGTFGGLSSAEQNTNHAPANLTCDELHVDELARLYDATGNLHYEQGDTSAVADGGRLNDATHQLDLHGNVHVVDGKRTLDAQSVSYNTQSGLGEADGNVRVIFPSNVHPSLATPKPIVIKNPKIRH